MPIRGLSLAPLLAASAACAQCPAPDWILDPDQQIPGVGSSPLATTSWDPDGPGGQPPWLIVGGAIKAAGDQVVSGVAAWEGQRWIPMGTRASTVYAFQVFNGQLLAFGSFTDPNGGQPAARWNGSEWVSLDPALRGTAYSAMIHAGEVHFAGTLQSGSDRRAVAAWNGSTVRALPPLVTDPNLFSYSRALASRNGELIASEERIDLNTSARTFYINAFNGSSWRRLGTLDNYVSSLHVSGGSSLVAGGLFTFVDGVPIRGGLARWDGSLWRPIHTELEGITRYVTEQSGRLTVAGSYLDVNSAHQGVMELDPTGWRTPGGLPALNSSGQALGFHQNELVAVGYFSRAGDALASHVASFDGSRWRGYGDPGDALDGAVFNIVGIGNDIYVGGSLLTAGSQTSPSGLFRRRPGATPSWSPVDPSLTGSARPIGVFNNDLVVAGIPDSASGRIYGVASWNGSAWNNFGTGLRVDSPAPDTIGYANCALQVGNELFVGGNFDRAGGVQSPAIAAWNGSSWRMLGGGMSYSTPGILPQVSALVAWRGMIVAAGSFTHSGGTLTNGIAAWDGFSWRALGAASENPRVNAVAVFNDRIIASGFFHVGNDYSNLASWDGTTWRIMDSVNTSALAVFHNELIIGGSFAYTDVEPLSNLARWNGSGPLRSFGGGTNSNVQALLSHQGSLFVGGQFTTVGGRKSFYFAEYGCPCAADFDGNGQADFFDYLEFVQAFSNESPGADFDGNGQVDFFDYLEFASAFDLGCE